MLVDYFVLRVFGVQGAFGLAHRIRIGLLIKAVCGNRHRRCMSRRIHAVDHKAVALERADNGVAPARRAAKRAALDNLRHVQSRSERVAEHCRHGSKYCRVARSSGDNDVRALCKRTLKCLDAHLPDDMSRPVNVGFRETCNLAQRHDTVSADRFLDFVARHIGQDRSEPEMQAFIACDFAHHFERMCEMRRCARAAGGAYQQRYAKTPRAVDALCEIDAHHGFGLRHFSGAQIVRAGIDRAHVGADQVRLALEPSVERRIGNPIPQLP